MPGETVMDLRMLTAGQIRAARALLNLKQGDVAKGAGLSLTSYSYIESGRSDPRRSTLQAVQSWFEGQGVQFISEGQLSPTGGPGVRLGPTGEG